MCREIYAFLLFLVQVGGDEISVTVKQGKLLGHREATVFEDRLYFAFYRVPYAQPPIGELRFKDPRPAKKWKSPRDATIEYNGACAQSHIVHKSGVYGYEDCLYLNIYTPHIPKPEDTHLKPVVLWIHGFAFASCFSHIHKPDFLINQEIIVVTVAHRIGVFGFLKLNDYDSNANMGLKDIIMALRWVRANIKYFGGDKNKITLMGSGSGASFISLLLTTEARTLFSKAILQSGSCFSPSIFQGDPASERTRLFQDLKRKHLQVNKASTKDIIESAHSIYIRNNLEMENLQRPIVPFTPMVERDTNESVLLQTPTDFFETIKDNKTYFDKPILIGFNSQESIPEVMPFIHNPYHLKTFINFFKFLVPFSDGGSYDTTSNTYKKIANLIKDRYFKDTEKSLDNLLKYASDLLKFPLVKFLKTYTRVSKGNVFTYKFDYRGTLNAVKATSLAEKKIKVSGVASSDEICYLLRCEPFWEGYAQMKKEEVNKDKKFIQEISSLWGNFIKHGDPNPYCESTPHGDYNVTWLSTNSNLDNVLLIRKYFELRNSREENVMYNFWNYLYENYYKDESFVTEHDEL